MQPGVSTALTALPGLLSPGDSVRRLLPVVTLPRFDGELAARSLDVCRDLVSRAPSYQLTFRPDSSAVRTLVEAFS